MNAHRTNERYRRRTSYGFPKMLLIAAAVCTQLIFYTQAFTAPDIQEHPETEVAYRSETDVILTCLANSDSKPVKYTWKKDNQLLDLSNRSVTLANPEVSGNLIIRKPDDSNVGEYQCFATNELGTAVSTRAVLKKAYFIPFHTVTDPEIKYPTVGESLSIECKAPDSYPKDTPYWGISRPGDKKHQTLVNDDRVQVDYIGNLHFANIIELDNRGGLDYICILPNTKLGAHAHGNNHRIRPSTVSGGPRYMRPHFIWSSPALDTAVKGQNKKLKCIFGGFPTPQVTWYRANNATNNLKDRMVPTKEGYGTELEIKNTHETDSGDYNCIATNSPGGSTQESVTHNIRLVIQSKPFWNQGRKPVGVQVEEDGSASISCQAHGTPKPTVTWGINGVNLEDLPYDSRRTLRDNTLTYTNLVKDDTQVVQCVASNIHGTILANAYLLVISEPPSFTKTPTDSIVVQGGKVKFECHAYGAPRPVITWKRGDPPYPVDMGDYRLTHHGNGDLEVEGVRLEDEDDYFCVAKNKHETTQAKAKLSVREPTTIELAPTTVAANRSDNVTLKCGVKTDPKEYDNLKVEWRKDGTPVDYDVDRHLIFDKQTFSLTIVRSMVKDTSKYNCYANNGLDAAESNPTQVIIKDRPEPPTDLQIDACTGHEARVSFLPGSNNNDPITSFTVYYSVDDEPELIKGPVVDNSRNRGNERVSAIVKVQPWRNYTFIVAAENTLGRSELSWKAPDKCHTPQMAPEMNPTNVCSKLKGSGQLVITWNPVPREEHYGTNFRYVIGYKESNARNQEQKIIKIADSTQTELVIHDLPIFTRYEISVWAENDIGQTPYKTRERKLVYSSEGKPLDTPMRFRLNEDKYNGTYGEFLWESVDTSTSSIRGFFKGYRIKFWRTGDPNEVRTEDIIIDNTEIDLCPPADLIPQRRRRQTRSNTVKGSTHKLWPYSKITAGVTVLNRAHDGDLSNTIEFETPEGPPEAVKDLIVIDVGSSHLTVGWSLPAFSNGVIQSFLLEYQVAPPEVGALRREILEDSTLTFRKILDLQAETVYRVTLYAVTEGGQGESMYVDETTLQDSQPDKPRISRVEAGVDSANVSFDTTEKPPKQNPGSKFYVEYAKEGPGNEWEKTDLDPHDPENFVEVTDLEPGVYFFRVVAVNGRDGHTRETRSDAMRIEIGKPRDYNLERPTEEALIQHAGASAGWFIVLMCIIVLLLLILLIICCIKRSKGDMYPVYEKEKMLGRDPFAPDDAPFGEYNSAGRPDRSRSQGSLDSDDKPMESDTDSLGEYEDQDASKFNEDGSFIGLYGGKGRSRAEPNAPAMNTFV